MVDRTQAREWCLWRAAGQASNALTVPEAASSTRWHAAGHGLGRRSIVADRRQCDGHQGQSMGAGGGPGRLGRSVALRCCDCNCRCSCKLRRHARMKDAAVGLSYYGLLPAPGRAGRVGDWAQRLAQGVCSWQSKHPEYPRIASSGGASEGLRSPPGLAVEDERLPWSLEAPGGED